jgi:YD repeat-containing protein
VHPEIAEQLDAVLLAVTSRDMNIASSGWRYANNLRVDRIGIVATERLRATTWLSGPNPSVFPVRVRKLITKNLAIMTYPLELSDDVTSAVANSTFSNFDFDEMGDELRGENGSAHSISNRGPCVTVWLGPNNKQSVRVSCQDSSPLDSRFESFTSYASVPLLVMSRNDFTFSGYPELPFLRQSRAQDERSRSFGMGATDSFDTLIVGDSSTFATVDLVRPDGQQILYRRYSTGTSYVDAKLAAPSLPGNPFGLSKLAWNGNGWDLARKDGWTEVFPSCGPTSTWQQCALVGVRSATGANFKVERTRTRDIETITAPDGGWVKFTVDANRRITAAQSNTGRTVTYDYDNAGRLAHVNDGASGDEYYQYDALNQLTAVLNAQRQAILTNRYGPRGEVESQTLADGSKIRYVSRFDDSRRLTFLQLVLPNGYSIK